MKDTAPRLQRGIVLRVREDDCDIAIGHDVRTVRFAAGFPSPRVERVSPGHLVAVAAAPDGTSAVVWRWYDAVVLSEQEELVELWEPAHGEVTARKRSSYVRTSPGSRAYLSAGLPGADWWVAGRAASGPEDADVELDAVERLYTEHDLWTEL